MLAAMYRRSTRETSLASLPPALADALARHAAAHQLALDGARLWLTHSENPPAEGFLGKLLGRRANPVDPDVAHDTVLVLHRTQLLVATSGEKRGTAVLSVPLLQASVSRGSPLPAGFASVPGANDGLSVSGFPGEHGRPGSYFVGLGPEPDAAECERAVTAAIAAAKNG